MGTTYISFIGTTTGFIIALNPNIGLFDGEWQTDPMPHITLAPSIGLFDGEWQTDPMPHITLAPSIGLFDGEWQTDAMPIIALANPVSCDVHHNSTSLILSMDGANGSTTFTDNSPSPKTVTAFGNARISATVAKFGGTSGAFDGAGDYLSIPTSAAFAFGNSPFTIEMWLYRSGSGQQHLYEGRNGTTVNTILLYLSNTQSYLTYYADGAARITTTSAPALNTWVHIAVCRSGSSTRLFMNGTQVGSTYTDNFIYAAPTTSLYIGTNDVASGSFVNGYIDDLRVTNGVARYPGNFTPPIAANPTISC